MVGPPVQVLKQVKDYLPRYARIFATNYDLLAYWAAVRGNVADLFPGSDAFDVERADGWLASNPQPKILFLHGALHLWRSLSSNAEGKHTAGPDASLLDAIRASVEEPDLVPLFISEGSSAEKVARIRSSQYLSFTLRALADTDTPLTVLGQALLNVDRHIRDAIQQHPDRKVAIGVYVDDIEDATARSTELTVRANEMRGRLPKCRDVVFFDSTEHPLASRALRCA